ncbi:hypothetical protein [Actinocorallia populi]|uniref:hypothetical protein n=1 Tax=Actinocorallia populi TaxID=2079200 RepID=UPI000D094533|nr:hypothetical protein [Actinocorallia populi]
MLGVLPPVGPVLLAAEEKGGIELFGLTFTPFALFMFALTLFFLTGVYSFLRQGLKGAAVVVGVLAVLAFVAGLGRM